MTARNATVTTCNDRPPSPIARSHEVAIAPPPAGSRAAPGPTVDGCPRRSYLELDARASAAPQARRHVRRTLTRWELGQVADDAELITCELVGNAIAASAALPAPTGVGLVIAAWPDRLMVMVRDASADRPVPTPSPGLDDYAVAGRGLAIVAALSTKWGWTPEARGKVVWASIDLERP
jgi:anti-sigma regulatory factor (Ser/Thr protein kinase)